MFTGIIEEIGRVRRIEALHEAAQITVEARTILDDLELGDSIAVNGVCLTVTFFDDTSFVADIMPETLRRSTLGALKVGSTVNLERALKATGRLDGHIVQGHVDTVATLLSRDQQARWEDLVFSVKPHYARYIAEKGSIAVNGVSLTVTQSGRVDGHQAFSVSIIPTTLAETNLADLVPGDWVNVEVDIIAKYVERLLTANIPTMRDDDIAGLIPVTGAGQEAHHDI